MIFRRFPYTNLNDINLDWIIKQVKQIAAALQGKQDKPDAAGAAGQVLGLDENLDPVWIDQSGGTGNYNNLLNKPQINNVILSGNKTASDLGLATAAELATFTRPNLLENWHFVGGGAYGVLPINQRGQASYSSADYTIDRWKRTAGQTGSKCEVLTTGIHLTNATAPGGNLRFYQDGIKVEALGGIGSTLTASVFVVSISGTARQQVNFYDSNGTFISPSYEVVLDGVGVFSKTFTVPAGAATMLYMINNVANAALDITIGAAKLERGNTQTLAHYDDSNWILNEIPDYGEEFAKCQRYFQMFRTESLRPTYGIDFRPVMATDTPTLGTITKDNVTYYTASSEL